MSSKKTTPEQRLINYGFNATEDELVSAINTLSALRAERFPRTPSKPKTPRKPRSDSGKPRGLPKALGGAVGGGLPKPNGGDTDASPTE